MQGIICFIMQVLSIVVSPRIRGIQLCLVERIIIQWHKLLKREDCLSDPPRRGAYEMYFYLNVVIQNRKGNWAIVL